MASRKPKLAAQAPAIIRRRTLKVLGTFISLLEAVRVRASADLGFDLAFEALRGYRGLTSGIPGPWPVASADVDNE